MIFEIKVFYGMIGAVCLVYFLLLIRHLFHLRAEKCWRNSLDKESLAENEKILSECLRVAGISDTSSIDVESIIQQQDFSIKEKRLLLFREGYTNTQPNNKVVVRKGLQKAKRNFVLGHELMHILYKPEQLVEHPQNRGVHSIFRQRDPDEQKRDYFAAALLLPEDVFWTDLEKIGYFSFGKREKLNSVYMLSEKYNVEPSVVARRIQELRVLKSN